MIYRWVEIALIVTGMGLLVFSSASSVWRGVGIGLTSQADLMLAFDYFTEARGEQYLNYLKGFA